MKKNGTDKHKNIARRQWLLILAAALGIYFGGFTSGYSFATAKHEITQERAASAVLHSGSERK